MKKHTYVIKSCHLDEEYVDPWTIGYKAVSVQKLIPYFIEWAANNQVIFNIPKIINSEKIKIQLIGEEKDIQNVMFEFLNFCDHYFTWKKVLF